MLRCIKQFGSKRLAAALLAVAAILAGAQATASADEPILYGPNQQQIEYYEPAGEVYHESYHGVYTAPIPEGQRLYGLRNFKPPGKNIYEPPPIYQPPGFFPGPFWPYYGLYGSGFYGPYGGYFYGGF
ncbi:hypothetical protein CA54_43730 [Symmachiella macrocystis]|uniref:Uncharacterized protein n=1 Tax=Symmachiella macrocystis TaxID=2527985 RepID=A0A5C6BAL9_9PLAN|nr:hypothetical protein [Symmachiella macrocystis]TWU09133.1 hypothetical protein CA54_43730 [Symmachiella macrocystis]